MTGKAPVRRSSETVAFVGPGRGGRRAWVLLVQGVDGGGEPAEGIGDPECRPGLCWRDRGGRVFSVGGHRLAEQEVAGQAGYSSIVVLPLWFSSGGCAARRAAMASHYRTAPQTGTNR